MPNPTTPPTSAAPTGPAAEEQPVTVERREGPFGEVVLRRRGPHFEIIANGCFLMDTSDGRSERLLVRAALDELGAENTKDAENPKDTKDATAGPRLLIGGLGVGFSLAEAADEPRWGRISVVEREPAILDWHRSGPLSTLSGRALADPRTELVEADLVAYVHGSAAAGRRFDAMCLDIDNGPDWTVTDDNATLYSPAGLAACRAALAPGGVLAVWSAQPSPTFEGCLRNAGFCRVRTDEIRVARGVPDVVHFGVRPA
ncbi:spermidine synthase [Streptomyces oryzae]|uniref:Spermidine synthase n=1 Tax=Streptomyces oryzae TaxID=1434886 RepID=A0ABS3XHK2_9ACTN|nr:spermidine synthase [Streptomyces oryzae]MBO8194861.1 spermidine synthase [Streptomyces oryzae]